MEIILKILVLGLCFLWEFVFVVLVVMVLIDIDFFVLMVVLRMFNLEDYRNFFVFFVVGFVYMYEEDVLVC